MTLTMTPNLLPHEARPVVLCGPSLGVVDAAAIDRMVMCGMIGAPSCSSASQYSMSAT
jgi:hypothetical protein